MPTGYCRFPLMVALALGPQSSTCFFHAFMTPKRCCSYYAASVDATPSGFRGLITFDLDNTLFPMEVRDFKTNARVDLHFCLWVLVWGRRCVWICSMIMR